jgi:hypothetical protein
LVGALQLSSLQLMNLISPEAAWEVLRFETASAVLLISRVSSGGVSPPGQLLEEDWKRLQLEEKAWLGQPVMVKTHDGPKEVTCPALLTADEVRELKGMPADLQTLTCQHWALRAIKRDGTLQGPVLTSVQSTVFKLRDAVSAINNTLTMPVPLPYYNGLVILVNVAHLIYSYSFLFINSVLTPVYLLFVIVLTNGLREVASALADPFGSDDVDFDVEAYIHKMRVTSAVMAGRSRAISLEVAVSTTTVESLSQVGESLSQAEWLRREVSRAAES